MAIVEEDPKIATARDRQSGLERLEKGQEVKELLKIKEK